MGDLVSGIFGYAGASRQARAAENAARMSAEAQLEAARIAAEEARFRPVGITSRFGTSRFQFGIPGVSEPQRSTYKTDEEYQQALSDYQTRVAKEGRLVGAGYDVAPDIAAIRDRLLTQAGGEQFSQQALQQAQGLFNLGQQFLPTSTAYAASPEAAGYADFLRQQAAMAAPSGFAATPTEQAQAYAGRLGGLAEGILPTSFEATATPEVQALYRRLSGLSEQLTPQSVDTQAAAQRYVERQQALLRPERERQLAETREGLFRSGRGGLGVAQGGDLQATNPEMAAYYNALAQQDAAIAANAEQQARANLAQDIGLASQLGTTAVGQLTGSQQQALSNALARTQAGTGLLGTAYGATTQSGQQQLENALRLGTFAAGQAGTALQAQQQAEEIARQRMLSNLQTGTGLFSTGLQLATGGYSPLQTQVGLASTLEQLGQSPLDIGAQLGGRAAQSGAAAGQALLAGGLGAARTMQAGTGFSPTGALLSGLAGNRQFTSGVGNWLSGLGQPSGTFTDVGGMGAASNEALAKWGI